MHHDGSLERSRVRRGRRRPWRLLSGDGAAAPGALAPLDGATNMAVDSALFEAIAAGGAPTLRLYRWSPACLSFGRNQPARGRYDAEAAAARGIEIVRRPTGGQAVLHDDELTYAVVAPATVVGKPRAAYARLNRALVAGLRRLGVDAALAEPALAAVDDGRAPGGRDWDAACFRSPGRGEVVAGGAKLVGSAQRVEGRAILQHGSILVGGSQATAEALLRGPAHVGTVPDGAGGRARPGFDSNSASDSGPDSGPGSGPGWTTLERELGRRPSLTELAAAVRMGMAEVLGIELTDGRLTASEREAVERLRDLYASAEWTWRR